jgi:catechol 2,3-dioxygenase-like lactoylglutathione lyase family enzyme
MRMMHVSVSCSDFDRSYDFYTKVVGMLPLTVKTLQTGEPVRDIDLDRVSPSGRRVGEARSSAEDSPRAAKLLGFPGESGENRATLLYWEEQPTGPFIDLQEWEVKSGGPPETRHAKDLGFGRLAMFVDDLDAQLARLSAVGVEPIAAPEEVVVGATRMKIVCIEDPDGTALEFVELVGGWKL